jgi:hypothetical protein
VPPRDGVSRGERIERALRAFQRLFATLAIVAIAVLIVRHRDEVAALLHGVRVALVVAAGLIFALLHPLIAAAFHQIHLALGVRRAFPDALDSYLVRLPARYVPGGIWHSLSRYLDMRQASAASRGDLVRVFVAENGVVGVCGLALAGVALLLVHGLPDAQRVWGLVALGAALALAVALVVAKRFARVTIDARRIALAFALIAANWLSVSAAFALYAHALGDDALASCSLASVATSYLTAAAVGFVAVFAPQGWGVAEAVFATVQPCAAPVVVAVAALTGFRLVGLLADCALFVAWWIVRRRVVSR